MTAWFIPEQELGQKLEAMLAGYLAYGVRPEAGHLHLAAMAPAEIQPQACRPVEPIKALLFRAREDLGPCFGGEKEPDVQPRAIVGVSACDLAALKVLDSVFLGGSVKDPYYEALRNSTVIISADCTAPKEVCFCTFAGGKPYAQEGYDLNLSPVDNGYVLEAGSDRGRAMVERAAAQPAPVTEQQLEQRDRARAAATRQVEHNCAAVGLHMVDDLPQRVRGSRSMPLWDRLAEKCVECAACNFVCPTCHCFLLKDLEAQGGFRRFKNWDACLYPAFAREASGANPRPRRADRLHGRLEKKFDFIPADTGSWGCVGCGRCVEACAGQIDVRETLRELINA